MAHTDLKNNNLMIDSKGNVKIIDFNNCRGPEFFGVYNVQVIFLTRHPDLFLDPRNWDFRIDTWALGATWVRVRVRVLSSQRFGSVTLFTSLVLFSIA
jgi:serine/threonine protein kinase